MVNAMPSRKSPAPFFDTLEEMPNPYKSPVRDVPQLPGDSPTDAVSDYQYASEFIYSYRGSLDTFSTYRREIEHFLHWCWLVRKRSLNRIVREDFESYVNFARNPPAKWIGPNNVPRFVPNQGERVPNPQWRPYVSTGEEYALSQAALRSLFSVLGSFFNFLVQEGYAQANPVARMRQKSKYLRGRQGLDKIRRLSPLQWEFVIETAENMAGANPAVHERTLFIMNALFALYLRISELVETPRWQPQMGHFQMDQPSQGSLKRSVAGVHVLAVEMECRFKAQGVPGRQATGLRPVLQQLPPQLLSPFTGQQHLHPVFAGVPGAGQKHLLIPPGQLAMAKTGHPLQVPAPQTLQQGHDLGTLQSQEHSVPLAVGDGATSGQKMALQPGDIRGGAGGIHHHHHLMVTCHQATVIDNQVVKDASLFIEQDRVLGFPRSDAPQIRRHQPLQGVLHCRSPQGKHPHMGNVKDSNGIAHSPVLHHHPGKLQGHDPAGKGVKTRSSRLGSLMEGGGLTGAVIHGIGRNRWGAPSLPWWGRGSCAGVTPAGGVCW